MSKTLCVVLCYFVVLQTVFCQFGFFQPNQNRNPLSIIGQGILNAPNIIRDEIHGLFHPNQQRPAVVNQQTPPGEVYVLQPNVPLNGNNGQTPFSPVTYTDQQNNGNVNFDRPIPNNNGFVPNNNGFVPNDNGGVNFNNNQPNNQNYGVQDNSQQNGGQEDTCTTVDGGVGRCISIYDCAPYLKFIKESRSQAMGILRKAHCGFEGNNPKVCCPLPGFSTVPPEPSPTTSTTTTTTTTTTTMTPAPAPSSSEVPTSKTAENYFVESLPEPPVCGVGNGTFGRVVGGVDASLGDFPWMALLGYQSRRGGTSWLCGGSLISKRHCLTAAHCIHNHEVDLYVVRLGELDLASENEGATPIDLLIIQKIKHELYNPTAFTNDIGILILEKDVEFTDLIRPICLPRDTELRARSFEDYMPLIAGWGHTQFRGPAATHLQVLQLPVVSNEFCTQAYSQYKSQTIDQRVLCAGFKKGGKDACQGDSGGPLMQPIWSSVTLKTYFYQIGVVSYGKKCAEAGFPGVYSRVTHFMSWIEEKVLGHS